MVFAVWAGRKPVLTADVAAEFRASREWSRSRVDEMVKLAAAERNFDEQLVRRYFTEYIRYELAPRHIEGLETFRRFVRQLAPITVTA